MRWEEIDGGHQRISKLWRYEDDFDGMELNFQLPLGTLKDLSPEMRLQ